MDISARRRALGAGMMSMRQGVGLGRVEAAELAGWPTGRLVAVEQGTDRNIKASVARLLELYGIDEVARDQILRLAGEANQIGWWSSTTDSLPPGLAGYIALEGQASETLIYSPNVIPGLFQTADYARAVLMTHPIPHSPERLDHMIRARVARRAIFDGSETPRVWAVIGEDALVRPMGGRPVLQAQLEALDGWIAAGVLVLQVLTGLTTFTGLAAPFTVLSFRRPRGHIAYLDALSSGMTIDDREQVMLFRAEFNRLQACALPPDASREMIAQTAEMLGSLGA